MKTRDFGLISALRSLGHKELGIDQRNTDKVFFLFDDTLIPIADDYYQDRLVVLARQYHESLKELKSLIWHIRSTQKVEKHNYK